MISHLLAFPMIAFVDMRTLLLEHLGSAVMHVSRKYYPQKGWEILKPTAKLQSLDRKFVYADSIRDFFYLEEELAESEHDHCVILGDALPILEEYGISPHYDAHISAAKIVELASNLPTYKGVQAREQVSTKDMLDASSEGLLLPKIHTLFYRIADKQRREQVRTAAFSYLTGLTKEYQHSGVPALDRHLDSPLAKRIQQLTKIALALGIDQVMKENADADEYELRYLIAKHIEIKKASR